MTPTLGVPLTLNYYQLLNVPATASPEQIEQTYQDRGQQQPRPEFSAEVRQARQELLDQAYGVLHNPEERTAYDQTLLTTPPRLTLLNQQRVAGLLLLLEAGQVAIVLEDTPQINSLSDGPLVLALAHRDLAAELSQGNQIAAAVHEIQKAQTLLHSRYPTLERELADRLRALRPRWILILLDGKDTPRTPAEEKTVRHLALQQFTHILQEREGIEGAGQDGSRLSLDQFFQFIQELLPLLDAQEQQEIFANEATRPSVAASYLVSQVMIAQGVAKLQPELIRQARGYLIRLAQRRDVALELAVCALLLGQVEGAEQALKRSNDRDLLASIKSLSAGSEDLLPGLFRYTQEWITEQLFSQTRDLKTCSVTLHDYFANPVVQQSLEQLDQPVRLTESPPSENTVSTGATKPTPTTAPRSETRRGRRKFSLVAGLGLAATVGAALIWFMSSRIPQTTTAITPTLESVAPDEAAPVTVTPGRTNAPEPSLPPSSGMTANGATTPAAPTKPAVPITTLDRTSAEQVIRTWQAVKQQALGEDHDIKALARILDSTQRTIWQDRAQILAKTQSHWRYTLQDLSVRKFQSLSPERVLVTVQIQEKAQFYQKGQLKQSRSYEKTYTPTYQIERKNGTWLITGIAL